MTLLIIDTSFFVAFLQERDEFHAWAVTAMREPRTLWRNRVAHWAAE